LSAQSQPPVLVRTLKSGLKVVLLESRSAPVVAVQVWVGVGSADERETEGGIAHVHEHMLFKGTKRRAVGQIASEVEGAGGEINAWTSLDSTVYHVVMASRFVETGLDILADAVLRSSFDKDELARELEVILEEIKRSEDSPQSRVSRALFSTAYKEHPYRRPVIGQAEVVKEFTREQILDFYQAHYRPDRLTVVAVGDFESEAALALIEAAFQEAQGQARPLEERPPEPAQAEPRAEGLTDDVEETQLAVGFAGPSARDDDLFAIDVLAVLVGSGESSRLVQRIRHEQRLVNEIHAYAYTPKDAGLLVVGAALHHDNLDETLENIGDELSRLSHRPVAEEELRKAKAILAADGIYQRETVEGLARRLGYWNAMVCDPGFEEVYQARIAAVSADDVMRVARRYLRPEAATVVALAPKGQEALVEPARLLERLKRGLAPATPANARPKRERGLIQLPGGGRVILMPDRSNPIVSMRAAWLGGLRAEGEQSAGFSNLAAEMLVKGTIRMSASEVAHATDRIAGSLQGFGGRNSLGMRGTFLKERFEEGFALFAECLTVPAFAEEELERLRALVLEDLRSRADNPAGLCFDLFNKTLWDKHPYRRDVLGTSASIAAASPEALRAFWASLFSREGAVVAFVGDFDEDLATDLIHELLARLPSQQAPTGWQPQTEPPLKGPRTARQVRDRAQAHLVLGHRGLSLNEPERYALEVLCSTLSGQGGRLFVELRDKQSLCYSVSAFSIEGTEPGSFCVYMGTSPDKVGQALAGIEGLLAAVCDDSITDKELARAQRYLIGTHDIGLQRRGSRSATMALNTLYGLGWDLHERYAELVSAVTLEDVRRVAQRLLAPEGRVIAIVGPEGTGGPEATFEPAQSP
jgi:zinc protease